MKTMNWEMKGLASYYHLSQLVAEAIESVLNIDVTIMNRNMVRIAGTGRYKADINKTIECNTAFDHCLTTGTPQIVMKDEAGNSGCMHCPRKDSCNELAEICVPIRVKERTVGVIGIIAFNSEQKEKIARNVQINLNFIEKMADLLQAKYSEFEMAQENERLSIRLNSILNRIDEGLIVFTGQGEILYTNDTLKKLLAESGLESRDEVIAEVWRNPLIQELINKAETETAKEITVNYKGKSCSFLATTTFMAGGSDRSELIISLQNPQKLSQHFIRSVERNQVRLGLDDILGVSANFLEAKSLAEKSARSNSNILIYGESGTGKELFARAIHNQSNRRDYAFLPINCGAIPDELLESELFGYEKGAFTGAMNTKLGKFEVADNGIVFLDEISEMPFRLQVKLLRVLQEQEICRIGSNKIRKINVRVISATNTDLKRRIEKGLFREDLYYRLNSIPIYIPPLRERKEDILFLANHFVSYYSGLLNKPVEGISLEARQLFTRYGWPGNVRELQNVIEYGVNFETGRFIGKELIEKRLNMNQDDLLLFKGNSNKLQLRGRRLDETLKDLEKQVLEECLHKYIGAVSREAAVKKVCNELGLSRATFYRKIRELDIDISKMRISLE